MNRRKFLKALACLPFVGKLIGEMGSEVSAADIISTPVIKRTMEDTAATYTLDILSADGTLLAGFYPFPLKMFYNVPQVTIIPYVRGRKTADIEWPETKTANILKLFAPAIATIARSGEAVSFVLRGNLGLEYKGSVGRYRADLCLNSPMLIMGEMLHVDTFEIKVA